MDNNSVKDLYTPPQATTTIEPQGEPLRFWGTTGRIGRLRYIAWLTGASLIVLVSYFVLFLIFLLIGAAFNLHNGGVYDSPAILVFIISVFVVYLMISIFYVIRCTMQRLQDFDLNKWFALLTLVPFVNTLFMIACMIIPGTAGANRYGPPPPENSPGVILLAVLFLVFVALSIVPVFPILFLL